MHKISDEGLRLLCGDEAFRSKAYLDQGGLPCCAFEPEKEVNEIIVPSVNTLSLLDETPTPASPPEGE